jgi:DNA-binding CsgD family transcriptional regulator
MAGHIPQLDPAALRQLRETVAALRDSRGPLPVRRLLSIAPRTSPILGITIDFEATAELGEPLVVVRVPLRPEPDARMQHLSPRELEIAALIAEGLSNKLIAERLAIATSTVKDHVHRILDKTGLGNRAGIAAACRGWMPAL